MSSAGDTKELVREGLVVSMAVDTKLLTIICTVYNLEQATDEEPAPWERTVGFEE